MRKSTLLIPLVCFLMTSLMELAFAQEQDISKLTAEKYQIQVENKTYVIHYGYAGSFEIEVGQEVRNPIVVSMNIDQEKKSLNVSFEKTTEPSVMWFRLPNELISAENGKFQVYVDGVQQGYDLVGYKDDVRIGMIIKNETQSLEIVGTRVIPEFNSLMVLIFVGSMITV